MEDPGGAELDRGGREQRRNRVSVYAMALRVHNGNQGFGVDQGFVEIWRFAVVCSSAIDAS